ncbi:MAG: biotin transporter BioY [Candidatus Zixiibacteriota bacterium]|nr:MAG: biotin transporter BioY [candidate division Zixibacteria bacterium]
MLYDIGIAVCGSIVIALASRIAFYLPLSPVPVTAQTFAVLLVGTILGRKRAVMAVAAYLAEGAMGLPVFANGTAGIGILGGVTGGYLIGFLAAGFVTGYLAESGWDRRFWTTVMAMIFGNLVIYIFGVSWLAAYIGIDKAFYAGLLVFLPGDILKIIVASLVLPSGWIFLDRKKKSLQAQ